MGSKTSKDVKKITLSLTDETEQRLRDHAEQISFGMRGGLSQIVELALREYFEKLDKNT